MNVTQKIMSSHLVDGKLRPGEEIAITIDQALLQDATGTVAMLEFESLGVPRIKVKRATVYVDHNMLQTGFENPAGDPYRLRMPKIVLVKLIGKLKPWVSAKDVILELLRRYTVSGGIGKIYEYGGPGLAELNVPQRSTIANMGAELGLTSTVFPSDEDTKRFFKAQKREKDFTPLKADSESDYDEVIELNLSDLEPLVAQPHSPDNVVPVQKIAGTPLRQGTVGSSVNSSFMDLMIVAKIIERKKVDSKLHMTISP